MDLGEGNIKIIETAVFSDEYIVYTVADLNIRITM